MKKIKYIIPSLIAILPISVTAQTQTKTLKDLILVITGYLNIILELLMGFAVLFFVFNIVRYFILRSDAERKEANTYVMWSLIGFFIILSFWGLVNILTSTFNVGENRPTNWVGFDNIFPK